MTEQPSTEFPRTELPRLHAIPGGRDDRPRRAYGEGASSPGPSPEPRAVREPLWREVLGRRLRALRQEQGTTLAETAGRAGVSPQYLSEVERGRKEPSSEMIAAMAGALGTSLSGLIEQVADDLLTLRRAVAVRSATRIRPADVARSATPYASTPNLVLLAA
ncbi:helix-turn-helix domain-containing protein [Nocardia otitidiscaviarum]|uniref:Helix-turn-helix domain-containing protein n=1 Tax=Nocardia otitidiscaviarum TaxID=1823 RepID=A0A516NQJ5_9NOCA|nr:helix-turn-helix domain-containing protein [Nocardia otitidiscaviarum]MCP9620324.1 helix-turn-helix domain-containing protein [Nocardia otitidiscaviarum]QDP81177.1 helix-turn-helix domain-containing protein [Nocardia otitidiscaviarum]